MYEWYISFSRCCSTFRSSISQKKKINKKSHLPNGAFVPAHTAEVLRQVEGAGVSKGGWVGGDSWFGSFLSAVEVKVRFDIHSTWVIKQNHDIFPTVAIHSVLSARHGNRPAGHWVVF
jgi:hypothetical protein